MGYKLFDEENVEVTPSDLQNKGDWCMHGEKKERVFVRKYGSVLNVKINPEKDYNRYAPDLINTSTKKYVDLKTQNSPFFQAQSRYSLDPQFTVVFNTKDRQRYQDNYPDLEIYFWVDWKAVRFEGHRGQSISVDPMIGVWHITFSHLNDLCQVAPIHSYRQRRNDKRGNAKASYLLDLREGFTRIIP